MALHNGLKIKKCNENACNFFGFFFSVHRTPGPMISRKFPPEMLTLASEANSALSHCNWTFFIFWPTVLCHYNYVFFAYKHVLTSSSSMTSWIRPYEAVVVSSWIFTLILVYGGWGWYVFNSFGGLNSLESRFFSFF